MLWRKGVIPCCFTSCTVALVYAKQLWIDHKHGNADLTAVTVTFYGRKCERSGKSDSLFQGESINLPKNSKERQEHMKIEGYCHWSWERLWTCQLERPYTDMTDDLLFMHKRDFRQRRRAPGLWYKHCHAPKGTCRGVGQMCSYKQARLLSAQPGRASLGMLPASCSMCFPCPQVPALENGELRASCSTNTVLKPAAEAAEDIPGTKLSSHLAAVASSVALCASPCPASHCCHALRRECWINRGGCRNWCRAKKLWKRQQLSC